VGPMGHPEGSGHRRQRQQSDQTGRRIRMRLLQHRHTRTHPRTHTVACERALDINAMLLSGASHAQVRVDQTPQKGEVRTVPRGKGYSRGTHGVLTGYSRGAHGVLTGYWRVPPVPRVLERSYHTKCNGSTPNAALARRIFSGSEPHPSFEHAQLARTHTRPLRQSLPPAVSVPWSARMRLSAHVLWCRSLARASSRSTWCVPVTGVLVPYMWRSMALAYYATCMA
jgi:hypothetical protein